MSKKNIPRIFAMTAVIAMLIPLVFTIVQSYTFMSTPLQVPEYNSEDATEESSDAETRESMYLTEEEKEIRDQEVIEE